MGIPVRVEKTVWLRDGVAGHLAYVALLPFSALFGCGVVLRDLAFRSGLLRVHQPPVAVISVGNLAVGGTGKTPLALWLGGELQARGLRTALLLRGYGGRRTGVTVISEGAGPIVTPEEGGDEAVMLAKRFRGLVITAHRRVDGVHEAAERGCDVVVLDDGFQHRSLGRLMDVVLLDERPGGLLPAGPFREARGALRRADAVVLTGAAADAEEIRLPRSAAGKPVYRMHIEAGALVETVSGEWREAPLRRLAKSRVVVVSGIARPEGFHRLLAQWDVIADDVFEFPDHHEYTAGDWQEIARRSQASDFVVTTEKDLVKLERFPFATGKLVALRITAQVEKGEELLASVLERIETQRCSRTTGGAGARSGAGTYGGADCDSGPLGAREGLNGYQC